MTDSEQIPHISVVIPTLNDVGIGRVVREVLEEMTGLQSEIIVVGRDDACRVPVHPSVRFIETQRPVGASTARNIGIQASTGEWLFFVDADCVVQPGWAMALARRLAGGAMVVGGSVSSPSEDYWMLVYNLSMFHEYLVGNPAGEKRYLPTLNLAVKRDVIKKVGLMDERLLRGQDIDWTIRMALAGYKLLFEPAAAVEHRPQRSGLREMWSSWVRSGYFNIQNRLRYADYYGTPRWARSPFWLLTLSPLIGIYVTLSMLARNPGLIRHIAAIPMVYLTKVSWCVGAARALRGGELQTQV